MPNLAAIKAAIERSAKSIFAPVRIVDVDVREDMFEPEYIHVTVVYDDGPNGENKDANVDHMIAVSGNAREILDGLNEKCFPVMYYTPKSEALSE